MPDGGVHFQPAIMSPGLAAAANAEAEVEGDKVTVWPVKPELVGKLSIVTVITPTLLTVIIDTYLVRLDAVTSQPHVVGREEVDW